MLLKLPEVEDYELSFKATGANMLICDIASQMFLNLEPLILFDQGTMYQYFKKSKLKIAAQEGKHLFTKRKNFLNFKKRFLKQYLITYKHYQRKFLKNEGFKSDEVEVFLKNLVLLCSLYGKMNIEYTDVVYSLKDKKETAQVLKLLSKFKDEARELVNTVIFNSDSFLTRLIENLSRKTSLPLGKLKK